MRKVRLSSRANARKQMTGRFEALLVLALLSGGVRSFAQTFSQTGPAATAARSSSQPLIMASASDAWRAESSSLDPDPGSAEARAEALPEAPVPQIAPLKPANPGPPGTPGTPPVAPLRAKYIPAGWRAQPLTLHAKLVYGVGDLYSFENFAAVFLSAGYEQLLNSEPNYGTDKGAFGERLGAAAIRENTQGIFTDMVFAPLLHEDSRYYQEGPSHNVVHRTLYAITRPLVTRKDNGDRTVNGALLLGYAASAALTPTFYPSSNRNLHDTLSTFGGSIGGAALGFVVGEFSTDLLSAVHFRHNH